MRLRVYVSGDTLLFDGIEEIRRPYLDTDVAILHLGGTRLPGASWSPWTAGREQNSLVGSVRGSRSPCTTTTTR